MRQALRFAGPYWSAPHKGQVRGAALLLLLLTVAQVALSVWTTFWLRDLFDALEQRALREAAAQVAVFALIVALTIGVTASHLLVKRWLQLDWRRWLSERLVDRWIDRGRHRRLLARSGAHDNPDGRIAEDIRIATENTIALGHSLVYSLLSFGLFVGILWELSGSLPIPGTGLHVPGYMVPLAFLYAGLGAVLGWSFGRPLVRATDALQTAEADFRFGLARVRERGEPIVLMRGERAERAGAAARFARIVGAWHRQSVAYMGIVGFSTGYGALLPVFPILVAAPQYIVGAMSLGVLMQAAQAFQKLASALSWPTDNLGDIARTRASADRVLSLYEDLRALDREAPERGEATIAVEHGAGSRLEIADLAIADGAGRILLEGFSCTIARGERVLVAGDSAVTSALFKVIGGLWPWGRGQVRLPGDGPILFLPQRPFLPEGTLREALSYPHPAADFTPAALRDALERADIAWLAARLDETDHWEETLPLRAQQRLAFARVLLQRPAWLVMAEATDAFDPQSERLILEALRRELPASGVLTISFHAGLEALHDRKIVLSRLVDAKYLATAAH